MKCLDKLSAAALHMAPQEGPQRRPLASAVGFDSCVGIQPGLGIQPGMQRQPWPLAAAAVVAGAAAAVVAAGAAVVRACHVALAVITICAAIPVKVEAQGCEMVISNRMCN